jgi:hypothetical protein
MEITRLTGPERVRRRPAVLFGSDGIEGVQYMVQQMLKLFATEAQLEHCKHLKVRQRGASLELSGDDRGLWLGQETGDDRVWQAFFGWLDSAPAYPPRQEDALDWVDDSHRILYGDKPIPADDCGNLELYAFRCACKYLEVQVNRNGISRTLRFERGENIGGISSLLGTGRVWSLAMMVTFCLPRLRISSASQPMGFSIAWRTNASGDAAGTYFSIPECSTPLIRFSSRVSGRNSFP